ncbi:conserved membrane hypothetical protein [Vibrio owensii]|uniref:DUF2798 domain-containing protein n=1 Tax=Vibrio owensii TaxID=696485 RepID=UPI000EFD6BE9|nr:DUF2798 domain-containing protein [Vibrio owensii]AYO19748.1 DUF2798 domain-containing protein [Vibrio owensii]CAH1600921.1 conserved membrane hypothetical protein [Vibrio owensii]
MTESLTMSNELTQPAKTPLIHKIAVVLGMMTLMGGTLTGVMTYMNVGYSDSFFSDWLRSFLMAIVVLMPTGMVMMTLMTKLVGKLFSRASEKQKNLVVGVFMALIMESVMAFITAANNIGFEDVSLFGSAWLKGLFAALPVAMVLMTITSMTIKPKIERFLKSE